MVGMRQELNPECPGDSEIQEVAAGVASPDSTAQILQHAAQCDHCGPLLNQYLEIFSEKSSPELDALIDHLPSSKKGWEKAKAREIVRQIPNRNPAPPRWWPVLRPRILAGAASLAALVIAMPIFGPDMLEAWQIKTTKTQVAAAYAENRVIPMRFIGAPYAPLQQGGKMGPADGSDELKRPELLRAEGKLADKEAAGKLSSKWLQLRGEILILKNPANVGNAEEALNEAKAKGLNDISLEIDLAISYFEADVRADSKHKIPDVSRSINLLTQVLANPKLTQEQKSVAWFNLAIAYKTSNMLDRAERAWKQYLEIDPNGPWAYEARANLKEVQKQLKDSQGYVLFPAPTSFLQHSHEAVVENNMEEYLLIAVSSWLPDMMTHPEADSSRAYIALAGLLKKKTLKAC